MRNQVGSRLLPKHAHDDPVTSALTNRAGP